MSSHLPLVQIPPWGTMTYDDWRSTDISVYFFRSIACCIPVAVCSLISSYVAIAACDNLGEKECSLDCLSLEG